MTWELLIVEDDQAMASLLSKLSSNIGFSPKIASTIEEAHIALSESTPDILFTDHRLPDGEGVDLLESVYAQFPELPSVMITGYATVPTVIRAFRAGTLDLISKPFDNDEVRQVLVKISHKLTQRNRIEALQTHLKISNDNTAQLVGNSTSMHAALKLANRVAKFDTPVLLTGETGTGKGLMAHWIHEQSNNKNAPWLSINCGAVAESVAESELFGYERGAFTGANKRKRGLLELAEGGTLFLDEINSASHTIQTRLLDFVQHGHIQRLGGEKTIKVNVRLIVASNQNLTDLVTSGDFRQDLFYRLNVFPILLPALKERIDDIEQLTEQFIACYARRIGRDIQGISEDALHLLQMHDWPGNVRELENIIHRSIVLSEDTLIETYHLPIELQAAKQSITTKTPRFSWSEDASLEIVEAHWIQHMLSRTKGNKTEAARRLGIDISTLHRKLKNS